MKANHFKALLGALGSLTPTQHNKLLGALTVQAEPAAPTLALEGMQARACPHCGGQHLVRNGVRNGLQRYLCHGCAKTFNAASGTPLSRLHDKEHLEAYAECMCQGLSIQATAVRLGMSLDKAFRWHHRFLRSVVAHQPKGVAGLLEVDETYFRESQKGSRRPSRAARRRGGCTCGAGRKAPDWVPVLVGRVRAQPYTADKVLSQLTGAQVSAALQEVVQLGQTVLCTDGHPAFLRLCQTLGIETCYFVTRYHVHTNQAFHVQTANNYHEQLKTWIQRILRSISTNWLPNYLSWHRMRTWNRTGLNTHDILCSALGVQVVNI